MEGNEVTLFGTDGVELGRFELSAPSAEARLASFRMTDGGYNDVEFSRPTATGFKVGIQPSDIYNATLLDEALAPTLARFQLTVFAPMLNPAQGILPSDLATCLAANTNVGCYNSGSHPCRTDWDYVGYSDTYPLADPYDAGSLEMATAMCDDACAQYGMWTYKVTHYFSQFYGCQCGTRFTHTTYSASCPRVSCGTVGQRDQVDRQRDCYDPGSCYQSSPYVGCAAW